MPKEQGITLTDEDFPETDGLNPIHDDDLDNVSGGREIGWNAYRECKDIARAACVACLATAGFMDC